MRTILWFLYFWLYLLAVEPWLWKVRALKRQGRTEEHDILAGRIIHNWARRLLAAAGARVTVEGLENLPEGTAVFVSNHQSYSIFRWRSATSEIRRGWFRKRRSTEFLLSASGCANLAVFSLTAKIYAPRSPRWAMPPTGWPPAILSGGNPYRNRRGRGIQGGRF